MTFVLAVGTLATPPSIEAYMDEKYLWPLVGVVLGSFLTFVTAKAKDSAEDRRKIGHLVSRLLTTYFQLKVVRSAIDRIAGSVTGSEEYERIRKQIVDRHLLEPANHMDSLHEAVDQISGLYPLLALELQGLIQVLVKNKIGSLSASSRNEALYLRFLSVYEVTLDQCEKDLAKFIRIFSWKHGLITYVLARKRLQRKMSKANSEFATNFIGDTFKEINKQQTEGSKP